MANDDLALTLRAAELWKEGLTHYRSWSIEKIQQLTDALRAHADQLHDASLLVAAQRLTFFYENGGPRSINIMGTMGCGKNSMGKGLAQAFGFEYRDADMFHTSRAKEKMSKGIPLTTEDRIPFLQKVRSYLAEDKKITSCSALTPIYRAYISGGPEELLTQGQTKSDPWSIAPENHGVLFLCLEKPFEVALAELDYAHKHEPRQLQDGTPHFIQVTKEEPALLKSQYDLFQANPLKPWEAVVIKTEDYRITPPKEGRRPTAYNSESMLRDAIAALGAGANSYN